MRQKIGTRSGIDELNAELDGLQADRKKEERQKARLAGKIMALDADDPLYDSMYETLQGILREHVAPLRSWTGRSRRLASPSTMPRTRPPSRSTRWS